MTIEPTDADYEEVAWAYIAEMGLPASPALLMWATKLAKDSDGGRIVAMLFHEHIEGATT